MNHAINIYLDHFGLQERPFTLVPDPDFIYWSAMHERAYAMFEYGIVTRAPITLITGEVGAGKTTLLHHLLKSLDETYQIGLISNAHGTRDELLRWVLQALDQPIPLQADYVTLFGQFEAFLISQYSEGRRVILIFDEAQNLSRESLEELRMFTNINANKDELLQLVLVGQPELRDNVRHPALTQFAQRVASSFHLPALNAEAVSNYINHRLEVAGARGAIFTPTACDKIFKETRGVPRLINQLCDFSLLYAYTDEEDMVTEKIVKQVLSDGVFFGGGVVVDDPEKNAFRSDDLN
ncbi:AAA family ATPase [Yoonia sp. F2084L]|uniref:ExeA family protein n=1 Tax=Yoonia sp. F2084L TaxID=2926419 RepID=UPI001FF3B569|nr:AAA family ATPase [Yoonia sp. F2084L]MCK0093968.1 AAA family ATPase [Yoonia sp. F2084L]